MDCTPTISTSFYPALSLYWGAHIYLKSVRSIKQLSTSTPLFSWNMSLCFCVLKASLCCEVSNQLYLINTVQQNPEHSDEKYWILTNFIEIRHYFYKTSLTYISLHKHYALLTIIAHRFKITALPMAMSSDVWEKGWWLGRCMVVGLWLDIQDLQH